MQNPSFEAPNHVGPYQLHQKTPNSTMEYGTYYEKSVYLPFDATAERMIRVWLPPGYGESDQRYPVIYFSDGQNLVDRDLSAYGDWHLDKCVHHLMEEGLPGVILVGIDCPKRPSRRSNELNPPYKTKAMFSKGHGPKHPIADQYTAYIVNQLKPEIDTLFLTLSDLRHTGIGGSSMGGIMAFYAYMTHPKTFGFSLAFSIPVFAYDYNKWEEMLKEWDFTKRNDRKLAIYVGGADFERLFLPGSRWLRDYLMEHGYDANCLHYEENPSLPHQEEAWARYSYNALRFFLKD